MRHTQFFKDKPSTVNLSLIVNLKLVPINPDINIFATASSYDLKVGSYSFSQDIMLNDGLHVIERSAVKKIFKQIKDLIETVLEHRNIDSLNLQLINQDIKVLDFTENKLLYKQAMNHLDIFKTNVAELFPSGLSCRIC